jgi:uncharacterized SAM-binding protein YcdF (DUF218 family)
MLLFIGKTLPNLFLPLGLALWTSALALFLVWRGCPRWGLAVGIFSWLWLFAASTGPVCNAVLAPLERPYYRLPLPDSAAAIVLLGGATVPALPPRTRPETNLFADRLLHAARLWREHRAPRLVTTGGRIDWIAEAGGSEAQDYASLLTELFGVGRDSIHLCPGSQNTREDAVEARKLFEREGWPKDILLVTSAFHMRRAEALFRKQGFAVHAAPTDFFSDEKPRTGPYQWLPQENTLAITYLALHEWAGYLAYRMLGWI